jgi:hypothetical protein
MRCSQCGRRKRVRLSLLILLGKSAYRGWVRVVRQNHRMIGGDRVFWSLGHGRRQLLWFEVTRHPTAEWLARQITEAFPWASAPAYLVRDNDRAYGPVFRSRVGP